MRSAADIRANVCAMSSTAALLHHRLAQALRDEQVCGLRDLLHHAICRHHPRDVVNRSDDERVHEPDADKQLPEGANAAVVACAFGAGGGREHATRAAVAAAPRRHARQLWGRHGRQWRAGDEGRRGRTWWVSRSRVSLPYPTSLSSVVMVHERAQ
jgi:hypothetical protein